MRAQILLYGRMVGVDFSEVADPLDSFASFQEFFTRRLVDGMRPVDAGEDAFVAPCDGLWGESGAVRSGTLLQVKGRPYSLASLLGSAADAARFEGGSFATFYLAPRNYHRLHAPCDLRVLRARYLPGTLWPVNRLGAESIDGLFARNERICVFAQTPAGAPLCLVAVGALCVGSVRVDFDELATNARAARPELREYPAPGHAFAKGEEWGRFQLGSTLVALAARGVLALTPAEPGDPVRLGSRVGELRTPV